METYNIFSSLLSVIIRPNFIFVISTGIPSLSGGVNVIIFIFFPLQSIKLGYALNIKILLLLIPIAA